MKRMLVAVLLCFREFLCYIYKNNCTFSLELFITFHSMWWKNEENAKIHLQLKLIYKMRMKNGKFFPKYY